MEPIHCSMSGCIYCFLTFIQISQEAGLVVWYSNLLKNFPQFIVIHSVKGFNIVNEAEVDVFLEFSCFFYDSVDVGNLISGSSAFSKTILNIWKFLVSDQIRSVAQSCLTLCDAMNHSTPGIPVHHQLPELTETHVHRVSDAIQPSHPLSSPSPPAPNPSQHHSLFQ